MKMLDLTRHAPPGIKLKPELQFIISGFIFSFLGSLLFLQSYNMALQDLYVETVASNVLIQGARMPDFHVLLDGNLNLYIIFALSMFAVIAYNYSYHYRGSKSIYLMRRLPKRWELHRRCLTIPLVSSLMYLLSAVLMLFIFYGIYMEFTPEQCLTPGQLQKLWSVLL